jgi:hypothetical protein
MALWAAFVIETPHGRIYHIGDTGFHDGINYRPQPEKHGGFRLGILPIGAYEPRWFMKGQHQNPEEAVAGNPSPTSAKGSLRSPGLRILSHKGRGKPVAPPLPQASRRLWHPTSPLVGEDSKPA